MSDVRILPAPLGGSSLSRMLQEGRAPAAWMAPVPRGADAWRARALHRRASADWGARLLALSPAIEATGAAEERLRRVVQGGGVVVTTGQQPGLFGGPVYTWSKAVSALALADALERETGIPTAAVFWAATDDADFVEASSTVVSRPGGVQVLRQHDAPPAGTPLALAPLGSLHEALHGLREACGSAPDPRALQAAVEAYSDPSRTTGVAYLLLLRALLAPLGVPVLDASHEAVAEASRDTLAVALGRADAVEQGLLERIADIRSAGEAPQVEHVNGLSLVFRRDDRLKRRLTLREAETTLHGGVLSPNVLLRPLVEQAILPTVAYVAGPGELAYFAQVSAVAAALDLEAPVAVPRWSCLLVEPQVDTLLARYGATIEDLDVPDALETRVARTALGDASEHALATLRTAVAELPTALADEAGELGLEGAVQGAVRSLEHRLDRLERRLVAGVKRRETARMRDIGTLRGALRPAGGRQERVLNLIPFLARHGLGLLAEMRDAAGAHASALVRGAGGE